MKLLCWTNIEIEVHIECESIHFAILCKESKEIRSVQVAVKKTHFNESCQARWAGGEYTFQAVAELYIVDVNHWKTLDLDADPHASSIRRFGRSYAFLYNWIFATWYMPYVKHSIECTPAIDHNDYNEAMAVLLKHAQRLHPPTEAQIKQLDLQLDKHGVLRSIGRLANSDLPENAKKPIFLPKKAKLTELVIMAEHVQHCHIKATSTLMYVRQNYWIPQGKRTVMTILHKNCLQCRRYDAPPFQHPNMPHLPVERVVKNKVFENCGVDFYCPIHIRIRSDKVKNDCIKSRHRLVSDNATNFKLTEKVVFMAWHEVERHPDVVSYCAENGIEWQYVTTNASWRAGFYEAIIKLTKNCLRRCIGRVLLDYNAFITLLAQTQAKLNSRPLTYVSDTLEDNRVIRPIDFVSYGIEIGWPTLADGKMEDGKIYLSPTLESREKLLEAIKKEEFYINKLWKDVYDFYLKVLREKHQILHRQPRSAVPRAPKVGEVVISYDELSPRAEW
uniref:Integrase zinc-binding domain-containing protein n=1 Tax=Acrobeloides nanus TaxID=290746 RepID=A0A914D5L6_9BILA